MGKNDSILSALDVTDITKPFKVYSKLLPADRKIQERKYQCDNDNCNARLYLRRLFHHDYTYFCLMPGENHHSSCNYFKKYKQPTSESRNAIKEIDINRWFVNLTTSKSRNSTNKKLKHKDNLNRPPLSNAKNPSLLQTDLYTIYQNLLSMNANDILYDGRLVHETIISQKFSYEKFVGIQHNKVYFFECNSRLFTSNDFTITVNSIVLGDLTLTFNDNSIYQNIVNNIFAKSDNPNKFKGVKLLIVGLLENQIVSITNIKQVLFVD